MLKRTALLFLLVLFGYGTASANVIVYSGSISARLLTSFDLFDWMVGIMGQGLSINLAPGNDRGSPINPPHFGLLPRPAPIFYSFTQTASVDYKNLSSSFSNSVTYFGTTYSLNGPQSDELKMQVNLRDSADTENLSCSILSCGAIWGDRPFTLDGSFTILSPNGTALVFDTFSGSGFANASVFVDQFQESDHVTYNLVSPEPASLSLFGGGLLVFGMFAARKRLRCRNLLGQE